MLDRVRLITQLINNQINVLLILGASVFVFGACSSSSSGGGGLTVTATAGTGGSISPASVTVNSGDTTSFTLTADAGYIIGTASGCAGSLSGNTYTTGAITVDCTVTASFTLAVTSHVLVDPTPGANHRFGDKVVILSNGNIVVSDPGDNTPPIKPNGAVHLYNPVTQTLIASIYGDNGNDNLGSTDIVGLPNGNFVIVSSLEDNGGLTDVGSVILVNGSTGGKISTIFGDNSSDRLGARQVIALGNSNIVIASPEDDVAGVVDAGSVMLIDGATGAQIGATFAGDDTNDHIGSGGVVALGNNNFVIVSPEDTGTSSNAGSVVLVDGTTGDQIGTAITGDGEADSLGSNGVIALGNNNYVIASRLDDMGGLLDAGSVRLVNGSTGAQINVLTGDVADDQLGFGGRGMIALGNGNFVVPSANDDEGGIVDAGSVRLVDGTTGLQIGPTIAGDNTNDHIGGFGGLTALGNNNFVIAAGDDDVSGVVDAGSVRLIDGSTGLQIGTTIASEDAGDKFGNRRVVALGNNHFVIQVQTDDVAGITNAGSVRLVHGGTGTQIGAAINGDHTNNFLGDVGIIALANNNFVIASSNDDDGGITDVGSVRLVDGSTGAPIGSPLLGDDQDDYLSFSNGTEPVALATGNFVVVSGFDDVAGNIDVGTVRTVNGSTGLQIGDSLVGEAVEDFDAGASVTSATTGLYYIFAAPEADHNGMVDSGLVRVVVP